jgi:hypothetical protein
MGGKGSGRRKKLKTVKNIPPDKHLTPEKTLAPVASSAGDKVEKLKWIRIFDLRLIPRYLFEQVKPRNFDLEELYASSRQIGENPFNLLYAMADENYKIKGFLWCIFNTILKTIDVEVMTVDKEYQDRGQIILKAKELMDPIKQKVKYRAYRMNTNRPKAFSRLGFKPTGEIIMELEE